MLAPARERRDHHDHRRLRTKVRGTKTHPTVIKEWPRGLLLIRYNIGCAGWLAALAGWLLGRPKKKLKLFLKRIRKFLRNFLMGSGSDTPLRIRKFLGNFLMGNLEIMKSRLPARIFSACS